MFQYIWKLTFRSFGYDCCELMNFTCVRGWVHVCIYECITAAAPVSSRHGCPSDSRWAVKVTLPAVRFLWWISFISSVSRLLWVTETTCAWTGTAGACAGRVCVWLCVSVTLCPFLSVFTCMLVCVCGWQRLSDGSSIAWSRADRHWVSIAGGNGEVCVQSNVCWQARWTSRSYDDLNLLQVTPSTARNRNVKWITTDMSLCYILKNSAYNLTVLALF